MEKVCFQVVRPYVKLTNYVWRDISLVISEKLAINIQRVSGITEKISKVRGQRSKIVGNPLHQSLKHFSTTVSTSVCVQMVHGVVAEADISTVGVASHLFRWIIHPGFDYDVGKWVSK